MRSVFTANGVLWIVQALLALFFGLGSGAPKLFLPAEMLAMPIPLSDAFVKFIGTAEVLGALGLILPGVTHVQPRLVSLAATALAMLTICAAIYQVMGNQPQSAVFALVIGVLCAFVAYGRLRLAPYRGASLGHSTSSLAAC